MGFENFSEQPIEQIPEQAPLELLKEDIFTILENLDSNVTTEFIQYLNDEKIDFNKYSLSKAFLAIMKGSPLPEQSEGEPFDTKDKKIEGYIKMIAGGMEKIAA